MVVERRTLWIGGGLLVVAVVVIAMWAGGDSPSATSAPGRRAARDQPAAPGTAANEGPVDVRLEELKHVRGEPIDAGRNPFRFQARRAAAPDPDDGGGTPVGMRPPGNQAALGPVGPFVPVVPPGPPPPPPIPVKVFGIAEQGGKKVAMLTDGRDPWIGKEGDIAYGQYLILKIGQESVEMSYADGRGRQTIRLTGQ